MLLLHDALDALDEYESGAFALVFLVELEADVSFRLSRRGGLRVIQFLTAAVSYGDSLVLVGFLSCHFFLLSKVLGLVVV